MSWLRLHLYFAAMCGLQLLLWLGSGLALSLFDEDYLDANRYRLPDSNIKVAPPRQLDPETLASVTEIQLDSLLSRPIYRMRNEDGITSLWADTLEPLQLSDTELRQIAATSISIPLQDSVAYVAGDTTGFPDSEQVAVFLAQNERNTRVLVDVGSGKMLGHKDKGSDLKELLLMLHFIDYAPGNGLGFNHLAIRLFALLALFMTLSGTVLVWQRWRAGYYSLKRKETLLIVEDTLGTELGRFNAGPSLLETINQHGPRLPTQCGGGGSCGLCALVFPTNPPPATEADIRRLGSKVDSGVRLACQHGHCNGRVKLANRAQERFWQRQLTQGEPSSPKSV